MLSLSYVISELMASYTVMEERKNKHKREKCKDNF